MKKGVKLPPIKPSDTLNRVDIPDEVFDVINSLLLSKTANGYALIHRGELLKELANRGFSRETILKNGWLNIEHPYRKAGWNVRYDSGDHEGDAYFEFSFNPNEVA